MLGQRCHFLSAQPRLVLLYFMATMAQLFDGDHTLACAFAS